MHPSDCPHNDYDVVLCLTGPHYAKRACSRCKRFLGWVVRPHSNQLRASILAKVNDLWNGEPTPEERAFLMKITDADGRMTPRQEAKLNGMWVRREVGIELAKWPKKSS